MFVRGLPGGSPGPGASSAWLGVLIVWGFTVAAVSGFIAFLVSSLRGVLPS